jgi:predicted Zn-dependent protease with MMP-like domain
VVRDAIGRIPVATSCHATGGRCGRAGRQPSGLRFLTRLAAMDPIDVDAFEALVADALEAIPDELRAEMENVAIIIDDQSPPGRLYGLYEGIPLTKRGTYAGARPDQITLFLATICQSARTPDELARRVRVTLLHEVGHHFGLGEARLRELGWA